MLPSPIVLGIGVALVLLGPLFVAWFKVGRWLIGGWLLVLVAYLAIYLGAVKSATWRISDLWHAYMRRATDVYPLIAHDAVRFAPIYILIASAAFTLFGLFFIVVRKVSTPMIASRLVSIAEIFGVTFLMAVPMLFFTDEPWWRIGFTVSSATALLALLRDPQPYPIDFRNDSPPVIYFWSEWLKQRRGTAMYSLFGLSIIPAWPVLGEWLFAVGLFTVLYSATRAATFLYITSELRVDPTGTLVAQVFWIRIPTRVSNQIDSWKAGFGNLTTVPPGADHVTFIPGQPKHREC